MLNQSLRSDEDFTWLCSVRWWLCAGEIIIILLAIFINPEANISVLLLIIVIELISNSYLSTSRSSQSKKVIGCILIWDALLFTLLLFFTGGASNPFSIFYITFVGLASFFLGRIWTWCFALLTSGLYGALFFFYIPVKALEDHSHHNSGSLLLSLHLQGMWLSFSILSVILAYFFSRLVESKNLAESKITQFKISSLKNEKLLGITTLAARAAHDLNTPLSTMKLIAEDMQNITDLNFMRVEAEEMVKQINRCTQVLTKLRAQTGEIQGEFPSRFTSEEIINEVLARFDSEYRALITYDSGGVEFHNVKLPIVEAVCAITQNAIDAMKNRSGEISLSFKNDSASSISIEIKDSGKGFNEEIISKFGEPFINDISSDEHLGLGLFLAKAFIERIGGEINLGNHISGAVVKIIIPNVL